MQCKSFPCTLWGLPACSTKSADSQSRPSSFLLSLFFKNNRHFRGYFEQGGFSFSRWMDSWFFVFFHAYCATFPVMRPLSCPETEQRNLPTNVPIWINPLFKQRQSDAFLNTAASCRGWKWEMTGTHPHTSAPTLLRPHYFQLNKNIKFHEW